MNMNNCKLINIVWIDRSIKLAIIFNILLYYKKLKNKKIIIENIDYRHYCRKMFPELIFRKISYRMQKSIIQNKIAIFKISVK